MTCIGNYIAHFIITTYLTNGDIEVESAWGGPFENLQTNSSPQMPPDKVVVIWNVLVEKWEHDCKDFKIDFSKFVFKKFL